MDSKSSHSDMEATLFGPKGHLGKLRPLAGEAIPIGKSLVL